MALHDARESRFDHSLHVPVHKAVNRRDKDSLKVSSKFSRFCEIYLQVLQKDEECRKQRFAALRLVVQPDDNRQSKERQQRASGFDGLSEAVHEFKIKNIVLRPPLPRINNNFFLFLESLGLAKNFSSEKFFENF